MKTWRTLIGCVACWAIGTDNVVVGPGFKSAQAQAPSAKQAGNSTSGFAQSGKSATAVKTPRMIATAHHDLFAAKTWKPPPPPSPPPAPPTPLPPPPKPVAPPFPYVFTGSMRDAENTNDITLFLTQGNRNFIVRKGQSLGSTYRLDDVTESVATFTYLPLQEKQRLAIGNTR